MHLVAPRFDILVVGVFCAATTLFACNAPSGDGLYGRGQTPSMGMGGSAGRAGGGSAGGGMGGTGGEEADAGGGGGENDGGAGASGWSDAAVPDAAITDDAGRDAAPPPCGGALLDGICWYLGVVGEDFSCDQVCEPRGGFDADAISVIGTPDQGGSSEECNAVMDALQATGAGMIASVTSALGIGCHLFDAERRWVMDTDFDQEAEPFGAALACGCNE